MVSCPLNSIKNMTLIDCGWYIYPDSKEPERKRYTTPYYQVYYYFNNYGEAWCYLIARFGRQFERYNSI